MIRLYKNSKIQEAHYKSNLMGILERDNSIIQTEKLEDGHYIIEYYDGEFSDLVFLNDSDLSIKEKMKELLKLKNQEIDLLKARLTYNDNNELDDIRFQENSKALEEVRNMQKLLEEELK
jgi:hypothetical protein